MLIVSFPKTTTMNAKRQTPNALRPEQKIDQPFH